MIIIHSTYPIQANKKQYAQEIMAHMTNAALRSEECVSYEFFFSLDQTEKILLIQEWRSVEAAKKYYDTPTMQLLASELPDLLAGAVQTKAYTNTPQGETQGVNAKNILPEVNTENRTIH
ncbi:MAG: antibiotic biosynthesis monooxygenase [Gammaproteobacteria bacterium]|nr:antibiotic biosynthesis monooxygenase [Gammaproteobacteria bacterium]